MAVPCDREPSPRPRLQREALIPLPPSVRRPFALIGASVALVFLAAVFDAVLWHYSLERDELRMRAVSAEQRAAELDSLREAQCYGDKTAGPIHQEMRSGPVGDFPGVVNTGVTGKRR